MPRRLSPCSALALLLAVGCQRAERFAAEPPREATAADRKDDRPAASEPPLPLDPGLEWQEIHPGPDLPLEFVSEEGDRAAWEKLPRFWNAPVWADPEGRAALAALTPLEALAAVTGRQAVQIKVPRGLPDPGPFLPRDDPQALGRWQLGRDLFFDKTYLKADGSQSCAGCHDPRSQFADGELHNGLVTPRLLNVVYRKRLFWDGRAERLEEVVQRTLEDERESERTDGRAHVWGGVVRRLRANPRLRDRFAEVFDADPTQDNVGRALAAYLRTLLSGDSLYDRARAAQAKRGGKELEQADFAAALRDGDLEALAGPADKADALGGVSRGYRLFFNVEKPRPLNCLDCHREPLFTDQGYHNLGVNLDWERIRAEGRKEPIEVVKAPGRFATVPRGEKSLHLLGAFRTPSLRDLPRSGPYFHSYTLKNLDQPERILVKDLAQAIRLHGAAEAWNRFLDPLLVDRQGKPLELGLTDEEVHDVALFLGSLRSGPVDPVLARP